MVIQEKLALDKTWYLYEEYHTQPPCLHCDLETSSLDIEIGEIQRPTLDTYLVSFEKFPCNTSSVQVHTSYFTRTQHLCVRIECQFSGQFPLVKRGYSEDRKRRMVFFLQRLKSCSEQVTPGVQEDRSFNELPITVHVTMTLIFVVDPSKYSYQQSGQK